MLSRMERHSEPVAGQPEQPSPCQCHTSFAYIAPMHDGHCCFWPDTQTCHPEEVAAWERMREDIGLAGLGGSR